MDDFTLLLICHPYEMYVLDRYDITRMPAGILMMRNMGTEISTHPHFIHEFMAVLLSDERH